MDLTLSYPALVAFLLVVVRAAAWLVVVPPFSDRSVIPSTVTMGIAAGFGVLVGPTLPSSAIPTTAEGLIGAIVLQAITGFAIGFIINVLISTITAAGSLVDLAGGLNLPAAIDPLGLNQTPLLGQFYEQVAVLLLFASRGYLVMIEGFARSFQAPGFTLGSSNRVALIAINDFTTFFVSSLEIAGPILVVMFTTQVVLAMLTKAAPQMNVWVLGLPLQIFLALVLVALGLSVIPTYLSSLLSRAMGDTAVLFGSH